MTSTALTTALDRAQAQQPAVSRDNRFSLFPNGRMLIVDSNGDLAQLDLQECADLLVFLHSPAAEQLTSAIIARSLHQQGGPGADLVERMYTLFAAGHGPAVRAAVEQEAERRGLAA